MKTKQLKENFIKVILFLCAAASIIIVFFMVGYMLWGSGPWVTNWLLNGLWTGQGNTVIGPYMVNTLYVALGGTLIGVIVGVPCAIYLAEFADSKLRNVVKPAIEVLNGFPSIVIGLLVFVLFCVAILGKYTNTAEVFATSNNQLAVQCILGGWIVLGIMSLPLIVSVSEDSIRAVPNELKEASLGLGATRWQTATKVLVPSAISGISASILLALLNAMGETMAVLVVIGNLTPPPVTTNPLASTSVLTAMIVRGATGGDAEWGTGPFEVLFGAGVILFVLTIITNLSIRLIRRKLNKFDAK